MPFEAAFDPSRHFKGCGERSEHHPTRFSFFRLATIAQGVAKRAKHGRAMSCEQVMQAEHTTEFLAQMGLDALNS